MTADKCVLVVDDIPSNRMIARTMLEQQGWTVVTASDGREALEMLAATRCDLVLLDISMPGMSGMEVCQSIRAGVVNSSVPVIAYTAHAHPEDRRNFIASGFDEVLIKPVSTEKLAVALASVAQNRSGNR